MKPNEIMKMILETEYTKSGDDVDWAVVIKDKIYLIFQQTASKRDWQNNFDFPAKLYKNQESCLRVARGWGNAYKSCNDIIMQKLLETHNSNLDLEIAITGWSYGGAMAVIAAEDFFFRTKIKPSVITFGAPKPLFSKKTLKYVLGCVKSVEQYAHKSDCVTLLPPFLGYKHLNKIRLGKFSFFNLFKPNIYHCMYDKEELYKN